ncbi:unnamed protein product [Leptidea sinapis]|uniref:Chitin-binding type-2 domain-containing protein n=1 Tax=Leptidea sinapis TaxID=189913 RepID=A0A5E4PXC7_9NEOP|nr:unnamed protein product [Leptidea sinapis]
MEYAYGQLSSDNLENTNEKELAVEENSDGLKSSDFSSANLQEASDIGAASNENVANLKETEESNPDEASFKETSDIGEASQDNVAKLEETVEANKNEVSLKESSDIGDASQDIDGNDGDTSAINANFGDNGAGLYPDQNEAQSRPISRQTCKEKNERYSVPGSCDKYIECLNGTAEEKTCPDGLRYNPNVKFNVDPCQYPIDVPCLARSLQPAQPTADCPHQFGYFRIGDSRNCGSFKNCVNGYAYEFNCPEGLAFSSETYRCEWPDQVADCDAEAFLGFKCPVVPESKEYGPPVGYRTYRSADDCQKYFVCIDGKPRRLFCGGYNAYDEVTESCVAADEISVCPQELRSKAERSRKAEELRQNSQTAFEKLRAAPEITTLTPDEVEDLTTTTTNYQNFNKEKQGVENVEEDKKAEEPEEIIQ